MSRVCHTWPLLPATTLLGALAGFVVAWCLKPTPVAKRDDGARSPAATPAGQSSDAASLVRQLLAERLDQRDFRFAEIAAAASGKQVVPLDPENPVHARVTRAVREALGATIRELNETNSPVRALRRINEASRFFEDGLHRRLNAVPGLRCQIPPNRRGDSQRSGYPDLRIADTASGTVFYLDPKLVEDSAWHSTLRTFYFEPKDETLKIADDAVHLLAGIGHDGKDGAWTFTGFRLVDLSSLRVRLKAEFQASNAGLYQTSSGN